MTEDQTRERATEALCAAVQAWLDTIPGNRLVFGYCDAENTVAAVLDTTRAMGA